MMQDPAPLMPHWHFFFSALVFVFGACVGSFLNVCIYRIPRELSVVAPRSFCPNCRRQIPWYLNIPLFSYTTLGGKCRFCGNRIAARYVLVELLVAVLFLLVWLKFDLLTGTTALGLVPLRGGAVIPVYWLVVSGLVLGTFVDFEHLIIPDRVTLGGIAAGLVLSAILPELHGAPDVLTSLLRSAVGLAAGWGALWVVGAVGKLIFKKDAMGFGDVKLLGAIGAFFGWRAVLFNILVSSLLGSLVGLVLVVAGRKGLQSRIPYGPYIALAALVWMLWGERLWAIYFNILLR